MTELMFYEKPGCVGNRRQKAELLRRGIPVQGRDVLTQPWTPDSLRPFFGEASVHEWFNPSAPAVKSGAVDTRHCTEAEALSAMLGDPLLIRRPLLRFGEVRQAGFVDGPVLERLGVVLRQGEDLESCPVGDVLAACGEPA